MEIFTYERPAAMPAALAPLSAVRVALAAPRPSTPQVHQVQIQAELSAALVRNDGSYGTTGFVGSNGSADIANKRMTDGASGAPPRGRPV